MGMLDGRVAICTGSGRGVGAEVAKMFAANGAKVVVNDPGVGGGGEGGGQGPAEEIAAQINAAGGEAVANFGSVTKYEDCRVPRTHRQRWRCGTVREMREGPSEPAIRCWLQTTASCCR